MKLVFICMEKESLLGLFESHSLDIQCHEGVNCHFNLMSLIKILVFTIMAHLSPSSGRISLGSEWVSSVTPFSLTNKLSSSGTTQQLLRLTWSWIMLLLGQHMGPEQPDSLKICRYTGCPKKNAR